MDSLVARLEKVTERLEAIESGRVSSGSAPASAPGGATTQPTQSGGDALVEFDQLISEGVQPLITISQSLAAEVQEAVRHLELAFKETRKVIAVSLLGQKPSDQSAMQGLIAPVATELGAFAKLTEGRRRPSYNHSKSLS
eukprot:gene25914-11590_t